MNFGAIYHKTQDNYCYPLDKDYLVISITTGKDIKKITLYYMDPFTHGIMGNNKSSASDKLVMTDIKELENSLFWSCRVKPPFKRLTYYFLLETDTEKYFMYEDRFYTPEEMKHYSGREQVFMFPWMNPADIYTTPDWVKDTVWYQIFVERFCNGNPDLSPANVKPWGKPGKTVKFNDFYGGDIPGITSKLDYLKDLGISGLYLTPICKGRSNHKYDTISYSKIDEHFGSDEDMAQMVTKAHSLGIRVMMDGVFNHSGEFFKPWRDVVKNGPDSKYFDWFIINKWPFAKFGNNSKAGNFYTFGFFDGMPKLNTNNPAVRKYVIKVVKSWIKKYDIDGLRLDVASEISHVLCRELRSALKAIKPDFYILGEIWNNSMPWLQGDQFDSVMNYCFGDCIGNFWSNKAMTAKDFEYEVNHCFTMYPEQANKVLFNLLDSHDTIRLHTKLGNLPEFYQQLSILFTIPGTVCIYYGTEIALEGSYDPDCRRCMPWKEIFNGDYDDRISVVKALINLRNQHPALRTTSYNFEYVSDNPRVISYLRTSEDKKEKIMVVLNCSEKDEGIKLPKKNILFSLEYENDLLKKNGVVIYSVK